MSTSIKNSHHELSENLKATIFGTENFVLLKTIPDGSCLFHAIYNALNKDSYRTKNIEKRKAYVEEKRNELSTLYRDIDLNKENHENMYINLKEVFYNTRFNTENIKNNEEVISKEEIINKNAKYIANPKKYVGQEVIKLIKYFEKINIILIDENNSLTKTITGFRCEGYEEDFNSDYDKTIFIKINSRHFEPLVQYENNTYTGSFDTNSDLVNRIIEVCKTNKNIIVNAIIANRHNSVATSQVNKRKSTPKTTFSIPFTTTSSPVHTFSPKISTNNSSLLFNIIIIILLIFIILISIGLSSQSF
jgi:hypothetical protein